MEAQTQIFFFISSVGFVFLWIFVAVFLYYLIRATNTFSRILEKIEKDVNAVGDTTKEMVEEVKDSWLFHLLFGKKRKSNRKLSK